MKINFDSVSYHAGVNLTVWSTVIGKWQLNLLRFLTLMHLIYSRHGKDFSSLILTQSSPFVSVAAMNCPA